MNKKEIELVKRTPEETEEKLLEIITKNVLLKEQNETLNDQLDRELIKRARLEDRIKKAIKYIKETHRPDRDELSVFDEELLEILEGKNDNRRYNSI